jgi:hypothetical protein
MVTVYFYRPEVDAWDTVGDSTSELNWGAATHYLLQEGAILFPVGYYQQPGTFWAMSPPGSIQYKVVIITDQETQAKPLTSIAITRQAQGVVLNAVSASNSVSSLDSSVDLKTWKPFTSFQGTLKLILGPSTEPQEFFKAE